MKYFYMAYRSTQLLKYKLFKKIIIAFSFILSITNLSAQKLESFYDKASKKTGFKDASGKIIIPPKYNYVFSSNEGAFFTVELNNKR